MSRATRATAEDQVGTPLTPTVPATWTQVDFAQAFDTVSVNNRKVPASAYLSEGLLPVIDQGQAFIGGYTNDSTKSIDPGEDGLIVFGDHTRIFKRVTFPFAPGADGTKVLRPTLCSSAYAYYACLSLEFPNKGYSRHYSYLCKCKFPVAPKPEQERIVSKIDELFSEIEEGERALGRVEKLVERYRQSLLKAAMTGELTREWREKQKGQIESGEALLQRILKARREEWERAESATMRIKGKKPVNDNWKQRYREPKPPQTAGLPSLPDEWVWATVEQLSTAVVDGVHKKPQYVSSGIPFVTVKNLTAGPGISFDRLNYISPEDHAEFTKRTKPERGDVLVSKDGTLGVVRVIETDAIFSIFVSVALVKPVLRTMGSYVGAALSSPTVQVQMVPKGTGLQHIHLEDLRQDCVPLCSLEEQDMIVDSLRSKLSALSHLEGELASASAQAKELRQAVLHAAFSGALLTSNPSDEPASVLLERIASRSDTFKIAVRNHRKRERAA